MKPVSGRAWQSVWRITAWIFPAAPWRLLWNRYGKTGGLCGGRGEHFSAIGEFGMDYTDPCAGFVPLSQDVERLEVSPMYRQKLLEVFSGFDEYTAFLERILEPVADRLEKLLEPWGPTGGAAGKGLGNLLSKSGRQRTVAAAILLQHRQFR